MSCVHCLLHKMLKEYIDMICVYGLFLCSVHGLLKTEMLTYVYIQIKLMFKPQKKLLHILHCRNDKPLKTEHLRKPN